MKKQPILRSQAKEIFDVIKLKGFDISQFQWEERMSTKTSNLIVSALVHKPTDYYFLFDYHQGTHWVERSPGNGSFLDTQYPGSWEYQQKYYLEWIDYLKKELEFDNLGFEDISSTTTSESNKIAKPSRATVEIQDSIDKFRNDFPDSSKVAFIMMQFGQTKAHHEIVEAVRKTLSKFGITGVRADDRQYHDDLFPNVLTYLNGCGFGIAIFERLEQEQFNPNVYLEVGYMLALHKPVCLIKDKTLRTLHTDLVGKLYKVFDPQDPLGTIPTQLSQWLVDKGL